MKKRAFIVALICCLMAFLIVGCSETPSGGSGDGGDRITVTAITKTVDIREKEVETYDFTSLFSITEKGKPVPTEAKYVDATAVVATPGTYQVTCTYGNVSESVTVNVRATRYTVSLEENEISVKLSLAPNYDYKALFTVTDDAGALIEITDEMITDNIGTMVGSYTYRVAVGNASKTLKVNIIPDHEVEIMTSYRNPTMAPDEVAGYDMTSLFSLYVDGVPVQVTLEMLDLGEVPTDIDAIQIGDTFTITLSYTTSDGLTSHAKGTTVTVAEPKETILTAKDVNVYINARPIELPSLFTIRVGDEQVPVTDEMLDGSVNYTVKGDYAITLTYNEKTTTATVHVIDGVVIGHATSSVVQVMMGTDMVTYPFADDFEVVINGIRFYDIPMSNFDFTGLDFSTPGSYPVTLTIPYNEATSTGLTKPKPINYTLDITYVVVKNDSKIVVTKNPLVLPKDTVKYDVFKNLYVTINGTWQTLTSNPDWINFATCYAEVLSDPIDFTSIADQTVRIAVYVNGPDAPYVEVSYTLRIEAGITISAGSTAIFSGSTLYVKDLFTIQEGHKDIPVTSDMISGKVDVFTPGVYEVTIDYKGITKTAEVVVLDHLILGDYFTPLTTVPYYESSDNDEEEDKLIPGKAIAGLSISEDGSISFANFKDGRIMAGSDPNTLIVRCGLNEFTLHYDKGIIVLDPENSLGTSFNDYKRPLVYFRTDMYEVTEKVTVGYSNNHVLMSTGVYIGTYSIDTFLVSPKGEGEDFWYGLYVKMIEKSSSDTFYTVKWGEASYPADFSPRNGVSSVLTFDGAEYPFTMWNGSNGRVETVSSGNPWTNTTFKGTVDGEAAEIRCDRYGNITLLKDGTIIAKVNVAVSYGTFAEFDAKAETIKLYAIDDREGYGTYSYFFELDTEAKTFVTAQRDHYFGKYVFGDYYLFFDGYGKGCARFDPASYATTAFAYTIENSLVTITYLDTKPKFAYGTGAEFYMAPLLNVMTVRRFTGADIVGKEFINEIIVDGAIVTVGNAVMTSQSSNNVGRETLLSQISIVTKDGVMSAADLKNHVVTSAVNFTKAGFYLYTIKLEVGGEEIVTRYTLQILHKTYETHPLAVAWHAGILGDTNLTIDAWGRITLKMGVDTYTGLAQMSNEGFTANVYDAERHRIALTGNLSSDGMMTVAGVGHRNFNDVYTVGVCRVIGTSGVILREITYQGNVSYYLSSAYDELGEVATVVIDNSAVVTQPGTVMLITTDTRAVYVQAMSWGNTTTGFVLADAYRGTYTLSGADDLVIGGFGGAVCGTLSGTYRITGTGILTVTFASDDVRLYRVNTTDMTYTEVAVPTGEDLLAGATYSATYNFICGNYAYAADTSFEFLAGGVVVIRSTSDEHDSGEDFCYDDSYTPSFASQNGVEGSYTVTGDHVTVTVNGETFVFHITNLLGAGELVCESTTLASDAHGCFAKGTAFGREA